MRKTPFYDSGIALGARMVELFGYYLPWEYSTGHGNEHIGTRQAASLCDLDYMAVFLIEGADALPFIQKLATNDFSRKKIGSVQYTALCDANGNMIDDCTIWRLAEKKFLLISGAEDDFAWLEQTAGSFQIALTNMTTAHTTLALQGPRSSDVMAKLTAFDLGAIGYYRFVETKVAGVDCLLARMGYTGEFGFELHFHPRHGQDMWTQIMAAGADVGIVPCGQAALESLRQEAGYLLVGNDHDKSTNPLEAGIGFTVKMGKADFNGRDALEQILSRGVKRQMAWFDIPSGAIVRTGDFVFVGGQQVGCVTSGSYSPTRKSGTAMGYIKPEYAIPGGVFTVESQGIRHEASLSVMPLYDPGNTRTRP